jgi:hypothetical protein
MSGLEVAGLVVGIIPVLLKVVTCYQTTRAIFHSFASSSTGVQRLQTRFKTQESIFRNECRHILLMVIDDEQLSEMLEDTGCELWHDTHIDEQLKIRVGDNYDALKGTLKEIQEMLVEVQKVLTACFGKLLPQIGFILFSLSLNRSAAAINLRPESLLTHTGRGAHRAVLSVPS